MTELFPTAKKNLARVKNYQPGKPIEEVEREYGVKNAVKMASNENALGPSPKAMAAAKRALKSSHRYPDGGSFYLRQALSKRLEVSPESIVFGNGSDELLVMAVRAFVGPGDEVVIADPTFLIYEIATTAEDGVVVRVPMKAFHYDLKAMLNRVTPKTKLVFIANPDNPIGTYVSGAALERFMDLLRKDVVVVLDEAYYEFAAANSDYPNGFELLKKYENLIVTRTFSKAYGLSGLRIGYAVANAPVANALNKVREPFNVNSVAQAAALAALEDKDHLRRTLRMVGEGRVLLSEGLKALGCEVVDTATNFVLVDLKCDATPVYLKLLKKGVIVRPMAAWGMKTFIRVTVGKPADNKRFLRKIGRILKELSK